MSRQEIGHKIYDRLVELSCGADGLVAQGKFYDALVLYNDALVLVPEPKTNWKATTWLLGSIGDAAFQGGYFETAMDALRDAMLCPDGPGNPFLHLRLGEAELELGNLERAAGELIRAYMGAGKQIFETEDPKYLAFLRQHAILPD